MTSADSLDKEGGDLEDLELSDEELDNPKPQEEPEEQKSPDSPQTPTKEEAK